MLRKKGIPKMPPKKSGQTDPTREELEARIADLERELDALRSTADLADFENALISVNKEITERRRAEDAMRREHARFSAIMDAMDAPVYAVDIETYELLFINGFIRRAHGDRLGEKCWKVLQAGQTGPCPFCTNDKIIDANGKPSGTYKWEFQNTTDGRWYQCRDQAVPWPDGRLARLEIAFDITAIKTAEAALRENQARLVEAQRLANIGHWTWDLERRTLEWSEQVYRIFGVDPETFKVDPAAFEAMIHPDDKAEFLARRDKMLKNRTVADIVHRIVRPSGEVRVVREMTSKITNENGRVLQVMGTIQDITAQAMCEKEKTRLAARKQRLHKAESLACMAGAIAHNFNNMLCAVIGNLEMAIEDIPENIQGKQQIKDALKAACKASEMSGLMLDFLGQRKGRPRQIDISEACRQHLPALKRFMPANVFLKVSLPHSGPVVNIDLDGLKKVITCLVVNAREAVEVVGGGEILVSTDLASPDEISAANRVPPDWEPEGCNYCRLTVSDTGEGIQPKDMDRIFDPFFTTRFTGRGMGLAVVLGIVRSRRGAVTVESAPGAGTKFQVFLPSDR